MIRKLGSRWDTRATSLNEPHDELRWLSAWLFLPHVPQKSCVKLNTAPSWDYYEGGIQADLRLKIIREEMRRIPIAFAFLSSSSQTFRLMRCSEMWSYLNDGQTKQAENVLWEFSQKKGKASQKSCQRKCHHQTNSQCWDRSERIMGNLSFLLKTDSNINYTYAPYSDSPC